MHQKCVLLSDVRVCSACVGSVFEQARPRRVKCWAGDVLLHLRRLRQLGVQASVDGVDLAGRIDELGTLHDRDVDQRPADVELRPAEFIAQALVVTIFFPREGNEERVRQCALSRVHARLVPEQLAFPDLEFPTLILQRRRHSPLGRRCCSRSAAGAHHTRIRQDHNSHRTSHGTATLQQQDPCACVCVLPCHI